MAGPCAIAPAMQTGPRATHNAVSARHCHPGPGCCLHMGSVRQPWTEKTRPLGRGAEPAASSLLARRGEGRCHCPGGETGRTPRPAPAASAGAPSAPCLALSLHTWQGRGLPQPWGSWAAATQCQPRGAQSHIPRCPAPSPASPPTPSSPLQEKPHFTPPPASSPPSLFPILSGWGGGPSATPGVGLRRQVVTYTPSAVLPWYQGRSLERSWPCRPCRGWTPACFPSPAGLPSVGSFPARWLGVLVPLPRPLVRFCFCLHVGVGSSVGRGVPCPGRRPASCARAPF